MTILYAESSAVLCWLLGEAAQDTVVHELSRADRVVTSALTLVECSRALARARHLERVMHTEELAALRLLDEVVRAWDVLDISDRVAELARTTFPAEPIRTLDALHLASARVFADALGAIGVLSFDDRIRKNASLLGLAVVP